MSEVYCFGHVSTGIILRLKDSYPRANGYAEVVETLENHAGEATGTALVLARLGTSVTLEGNWIGDTPQCRRTLDFLRSRGIDCSGLVVKPGYAGVTEIVVSDGGSRTVFGRYVDLLFTTPQWEMPDPDRIREARIVCVDPSFGEATSTAARTAQAAGKALVTSDTRVDAELTETADALVISGELVEREYAAADRASLFAAYLERSPGLVVFTSGSGPVWYARGRRVAPGPGLAPPGVRREIPPFAVDVIDSAGAGDSFRGALIHAMLQGLSDDHAVRFACAVAALVCTTAPGCLHPPTREQVEALLRAKTARQ